MTTPDIIDPARLLGEALAESSRDLMRSMLQTIINTLLSADADAVGGAEWGQRSRSARLSAMGTGTATWTPGSARSTAPTTVKNHRR